ncbi:MAG: CRTAC1 family protein [Gammaproteobacteria bacterium]
MNQQRGQQASREPATQGDGLHPEMEQDDAVIGVALRRSLVGIVIIVAVVVAVLWWRGRPEVQAPVDEQALAKPTTALVAPEAPRIPFVDITDAAGISFEHDNGAAGERLLPETMGGGVAFFSLDEDGLPDLLFVNSNAWPWTEASAEPSTPALYRNLGNGRFQDVTAGSGMDQALYGMGVATGDYDGDGRVDVFITAVGPNRLLRNIGAGRFEDLTAEAGVAGGADSWSSSAAFLDYDRDGDLDLFVVNYVQWSRALDFEVDYRLAGIGRAYGPPTNFAGTDNYLYRNDGDGRFTEVGAIAGIRVHNADTGVPVGKGLAVLAEDLDLDGWTDLVVANDTVRNFLFRNVGGRFEEQGVNAGLAFDNTGSATGAMGIDGGRIGDQGEYAVAIGNFANEMTSFFVDPVRNGLFNDEAIVTGIGPASRSVLSFGVFLFDADLDGRLDLLQANGHVEDEINRVQPSQQHAQAAQLFWNCGLGCERQFIPLAAAETGDLALPMVGRGASYADIDGDGDLDVVLTQAGGRPRLLRNEQSLGHRWLRVRLRGTPPNTAAVGARLLLDSGDRIQERQVSSARSYLSQTELVQTFGLGDAPSQLRLEIHWPNGSTQVLTGIEAGQELLIEQTAAQEGQPAT